MVSRIRMEGMMMKLVGVEGFRVTTRRSSRVDMIPMVHKCGLRGLNFFPSGDLLGGPEGAV